MKWVKKVRECLLIRYMDIEFNMCIICVGDKGNKGELGEKGDTGFDGSQGIVGEQGAQGPVGNQVKYQQNYNIPK